MNMEKLRSKKVILSASLGISLWGIVAWLFFAAPLALVNILPELLPLSVLAFLLFLVGLLLLTFSALSQIRIHTPRSAWTIVVLASCILVLYNLSPLAPAWRCFGKRLYVTAVNAAGQNCTEKCTNWDAKACSGWSSCYGKLVSCNAAGRDQDGRSCLGCCFSCEVVCAPDPDRPPTITSSLFCSQWGSNGWCVGSASLNLTASDPQGYTLTITGNIGGTPFTCAAGTACSKPLPDGNGAISYTVTASQSGKSATGTTTWKRDTIPPAVVQVVPSPTGSNGWFNTVPVAISASGSDAMSGLSVAQISVNGDAWQSGVSLSVDSVYTIDFRTVDNAGNYSTSTTTVNIDTTPPVFTYSTNGVLGNAPWYVSSATTTIAPADLLSGIGYVEYNENGTGWQNGTTIVSKDGVNAISVRVFDVAGNSTTGSATVSVDTTPPAITPSISGTPGSNSWITTTGIVSALVDDATSGVNAGAEVSIDGGSSWQAGPISLSDGNYNMTFRAFDLAGNEGSAYLNASIDTVAPGLSFVFKGTRGTNGWYVSDVDASASATDALSGVDYSEVRVTGGVWLAETLLSDGVHDLEARAGDLAGNATSISHVIRIDTKPPVSLFTSHISNEVVAGIVNLQGVSSDMLSGLNAVEVSTDEGSTWKEASLSGDIWNYEWDTKTLQNGAYTVKIRGVDAAGNRETPISLTLLADNFPPHVKVTDSWWIWESGNVRISDNGFSIHEIKVTINDPQGRWPSVVLTYNPSTTSFDLTWDRRFSDGTLAPSGTYSVNVLACDIHGNCASDRGVINIPFIAPIPPTATPSPVPSPTLVSSMTAISSPTPHVQNAAPQTPLPDFVELESEQPTSVEPNTPILPVLAVVCLIALMWAISSDALADPRPRAILAIAKTLSMRR